MTVRDAVPTLALTTAVVAVSTLGYAGHFAYDAATYVPAPSGRAGWPRLAW